MKNIKKYAFNILLIIAVSLLSVYFALKGDFLEVTTILKDLSLGTLFLLLLVGLMPNFIEGLILKKFANLYLPSFTFMQGAKNAFTGSFFSGITPFASGGQFAQAYIFKKHGISYTNSTGILLMHFILYQICLVVYTALILIFKFSELSNFYHGFLSLAVLGFLVNTSVIVALMAGALSYKFQHFLTDTVLKMASRFHLVKNYEERKKHLEKYLVDFHRELKVIQRHPKEMISILMLFMLKLTILYSIPYVIVRTLGISLAINEFPNYFAICAFVYLITAFIPIPGASGGSEGTYVVLFTALMGDVLARSTMLIWRFITYYFIVILGSFIFMMASNERKGENKQ